MKEQFGLPVRHGCRCVGLPHGAYYRTQTDWMERDAAVIEALNAMVEAHPRWGTTGTTSGFTACTAPWV